MSDRPIKLLLIDDDPIFRLGLCTALESFTDLQVIAQADTAAAALERLAEQVPDLVVLELGLGRSSPEQVSGLQLCQQLKRQYPSLGIFLLSATSQPQELLAAQGSGVEGYCSKGTAISDIVRALRQVASGEACWQALGTSPRSKDSRLLQFVPRSKWLSRLRQSGLQQIEESLAGVRSHLENSPLSLFDWLFWSGRHRELLAAHWLVNQLLPVEVIVVPEKSNSEQREQALIPIPSSSELPMAIHSEKSITSAVFDNTLAKIQSNVENLTGVPLEIDILQADKKRELLYLVLNQVGKVLDELRFLQVTPEQLPERRSLILRDLWQSSTIDFFSKYYTPAVEVNEDKIVDILLQDAVIIQAEILDKIPLAVELLAYLLFEKPLLIDNVPYRAEAPEAMTRAEILLQNLINQVANGVMQIILNNFSEVETIKQNLYDNRFISSREIARFRNNLSWRYRQEKYFEEPKTIFESQYRLFWFNDNSIKKLFIYAPRQQELNQLRGIPWAMSIALETRDAIAPRLRAVVAFLGSGLVYVLTKVIGRGLGLIGRGIIQGVGNTLQDSRYGKNSESEK
ncbi:MAG: DUF3685 domain-containing protein [Xenococcaceae cyanobacterium]